MEEEEDDEVLGGVVEGAAAGRPPSTTCRRRPGPRKRAREACEACRAAGTAATTATGECTCCPDPSGPTLRNLFATDADLHSFLTDVRSLSAQLAPSLPRPLAQGAAGVAPLSGGAPALGTGPGSSSTTGSNDSNDNAMMASDAMGQDPPRAATGVSTLFCHTSSTSTPSSTSGSGGISMDGTIPAVRRIAEEYQRLHTALRESQAATAEARAEQARLATEGQQVRRAVLRLHELRLEAVAKLEESTARAASLQRAVTSGECRIRRLEQDVRDKHAFIELLQMRLCQAGVSLWGNDDADDEDEDGSGGGGGSGFGFGPRTGFAQG